MSNTSVGRTSSPPGRLWDLVGLIALFGATHGVVGCSSSSSATAPNTGSLTVTMAAPSGVRPNVTVTGPGGYTKALSTTTTLTGLAAGSYAVSAVPATTAAPIVGTVNTATVSGSPATVVVGAAPAMATATYAQRPGSGGLWVANNGAQTVVQYTATQLGGTTSAAPTTAITTGRKGPEGVAFDASGNLWVATDSPTSVVEYPASQLSATGTPTPAVILSANAGSLDGPVALAFDASGNLWVANFNDSSLVEFIASQLAASGNPTPAVILGASNGSLKGPSGLAFDASGNLWVANEFGASAVEFTVGQLATSGSPTPAVTISASSGSLNMPFGLAFDTQGHLWVANFGSNTVVGFTPTQLASTGSPAPAVTLSASSGSLNGPSYVAFDASGNLWVGNDLNASSVVEFAASQLVMSGSPTPSVTVSGSSLSAPVGLAFDPHAAGLPLKP